MTGNVYNWNDLDGTTGSSRGLRGGSWVDGLPLYLSSILRSTNVPTDEFSDSGIRLASPVPVPEPVSLGLAATGGLATLGWTMLRRRKRHAVCAAASRASQPTETTS